MNTIDTSQIVDPATEQPFTGPSLAFLQSTNKEMFKGICRSIMGATNYGVSSIQGIAMCGCTILGFGNTITEGFIFFNDELFYFTGATGLNTFVNVPVFILSTTQDATADPLTFTDGTVKNVHNIRRLVIADQVSGTGLFDMSTLIRLSSPSLITASLNSGYSGTVKYYKDLSGIVRISGSVNYTGSISTPIFTLQSGFTPSTTKTIISVYFDGTPNALIMGTFTIATNGNVTLNPSIVGTNKIIYLDHLSFYSGW